MIDSPVIFGLMTSSIICLIIYFILREKNKYNEDKYNETKQDIIGLFFIILIASLILLAIFHPLTLPVVSPETRNLSNHKKRRRTGAVAITAPAIRC